MTLRTRLLLSAALGLGMCLGSVAASSAADHNAPRYYPGSAPCPTPIYPSYPVPSTPSPVTPGTPAAPGTPAQPAQPAQPADQAAPSMDLASAIGAGGDAGGGSAAGAGHLGRADQNNRLNIFDTQAAIPQNRVWFSYQRVNDYKTGFNPAPSPSFIDISSITSALSSSGVSPNIIQRQEESLYRVGAEVKLSCNLSISVQGQYMTFDGDDNTGNDTFTNPQILLKYALINSPGRAVSATLGYQPDINSDFLEFNDNTHAIYPGMLFFQEVSCKCFAQGGFQFRIPFEDNNVYTFDYALSFGYWLWKHPSLEGGYWGNGCNGCGKKPLIVGLVPQIEFFGKEVIGDATIENPFGTSPLSFFDSTTGTTTFFNPFVYEEPRHVYDVTVGAKIVLAGNSSISGAVSYPLTGDSVRKAEYFVTLNFGF